MPPKKKKASGDASKGEKVFKNLCAVCHSLSAHSVGPALGAAAGNNIASGDGFAYSGALSAKATLKWSDVNLDKWLASPASFAPGNAMAFAGIPSVKDRTDLIAFLKGG
jgi:cytochrome c